MSWEQKLLSFSKATREAADLLAPDVDRDREEAKYTSQGAKDGKGAVVAGILDEGGDAVADAKGDDAAERTDDDQDGTGAGGVGIEQVGNGDDVGAHEGEVVGGHGPDVDEPVIVLWVAGALSVENGGEDAHDDRESKCDDAVLRFVDAPVTVGLPFDDFVGTVAKEREGDDCDYDLAAVDVRRGAVRPVIWGSSDYASVGCTDGDVDAKGQPIQAHGPEHIGEEHDDKGLLEHNQDLGPVRRANPKAHVGSPGPWRVVDKVELGAAGTDDGLILQLARGSGLKVLGR